MFFRQQSCRKICSNGIPLQMKNHLSTHGRAASNSFFVELWIAVLSRTSLDSCFLLRLTGVAVLLLSPEKLHPRAASAENFDFTAETTFLLNKLIQTNIIKVGIVNFTEGFREKQLDYNTRNFTENGS